MLTASIWRANAAPAQSAKLEFWCSSTGNKANNPFDSFSSTSFQDVPRKEHVLYE